MVIPLLENHLKNTRDHRLKENSWPRRCVFSDLCIPFKYEEKDPRTGKKTGNDHVILTCIIPPTQNFWSVYMAMYVLYGDPKYFNTHAKTTRNLLKEITIAKTHVKNLTDNLNVWMWLQKSADGLRSNEFMIDPVKCISNLHNECLIAQGKLPEEKLLYPPMELNLIVQKQYNEIKSKWKEAKERKKNDGQSQRTDQHIMEGECGLGAGHIHGVLGGTHDGVAENGTKDIHGTANQDIRSSDNNTVDG